MPVEIVLRGVHGGEGDVGGEDRGQEVGGRVECVGGARTEAARA